jgi:hypothetical protein
MRRLGFHCFVLVSWSVAACGQTELQKRDLREPAEGSGGSRNVVAPDDDATNSAGGGMSEGQAGDVGAGEAGGAGVGGAEAGGEGGEAGGDLGGTGGVDVGGTGGAHGGSGGADLGGSAGAHVGGSGGGGTATCEPPTGLRALGDYSAPGGEELWLRDSGKAVTMTRVPAGKPIAGKLPALWQVVENCAPGSFLVLRGAAGGFQRFDYIESSSALTACLSAASAATSAQARELPPADRTNTIDDGCNGGPWTRFAKGGN